MNEIYGATMDETAIIGIDCATDDSKIGLSLAMVTLDQCSTNFVGACSSEVKVADQVSNWLRGFTRALIAIDAPLGWPSPLGKALTGHAAGQPLTMSANALFRRATDRFVKERLGKQSLDVGADRIARTAHSALNLLAEVRRNTGLAIPLGWEPQYSEPAVAIEVYPAATLIAHGMQISGYKKKDRIAERKAIIRRLEQLIKLPDDTSPMERSADSLDAAVCVLAGFDFLQGNAYTPENADLAQHEGWIWVRADHMLAVVTKAKDERLWDGRSY